MKDKNIIDALKYSLNALSIMYSIITGNEIIRCVTGDGFDVLLITTLVLVVFLLNVLKNNLYKIYAHGVIKLDKDDLPDDMLIFLSKYCGRNGFYIIGRDVAKKDKTIAIRVNRYLKNRLDYMEGDKITL